MCLLNAGVSRRCIDKIHTNQDKFGSITVSTPNDEKVTLAVICDGISNSFEGKYASYNTVMWILQWASEYYALNVFDVRKSAYEIQNQMVQFNHDLNVFSDNHSDLNTNEKTNICPDTCCTVCGIVTDGKNLLVFNAGDSRLYELKQDGRKRCMTLDDRGGEGRDSYITMHIGGQDDCNIRISFSVEPFHTDSIYMLCTDGFYKRCDFAKCNKLFRLCKTRKELETALDEIVDNIVELGEKDDISSLTLLGVK